MKMKTRLKDKCFVYVLTLVFVVLCFLICRCSWVVIERLTNEAPRQNTHIEAIKIQMELSDTLNRKILDGLKSIQKNLQEMKSDSVIVTVDKVHKRLVAL